MKKTTFIIQFLLVLLIPLLLSLFFWRTPVLLLDYASLILNILFMLLAMRFIFGMNQSLHHFKVVFMSEAGEKEKKRAIHFFKSMTAYQIIFSIASSIAILCLYSGNMDHTIGRFWGVGWVTPLYALFICVSVYLPMQLSIEKSLLQ